MTLMSWLRRTGFAALLFAVFLVSCGTESERPGGSPTPNPMRIRAEKEGVRFSLARGCLPAGRKQTVVVHTEAGNGATLNTRYADGKAGVDKPVGGGYGGWGAFVAGANGVGTKSWDIASGAPPGRVRVKVTVLLPGQKLVIQELSFLLVRKDEKCQ